MFHPHFIAAEARNKLDSLNHDALVRDTLARAAASHAIESNGRSAGRFSPLSAVLRALSI